jgi:hypothetical protein
MFNTKSDVKQQKDFLLQVFEEEVDLAAEEGELLDEEINEMLARNEEELALFARMDEQRKKDDKAWQSPYVLTSLASSLLPPFSLPLSFSLSLPSYLIIIIIPPPPPHTHTPSASIPLDLRKKGHSIPLCQLFLHTNVELWVSIAGTVAVD